MTPVQKPSEAWKALPWKKIQRNVFRLQKRIYRAKHCGLPLTAEDVIEVHHLNGHHKDNRYLNLSLLHGHCHDIAHAATCL